MRPNISTDEWVSHFTDPRNILPTADWILSRVNYDPKENGYWESMFALTSASLGVRSCVEPSEHSSGCGSFWHSLYAAGLAVPQELVLGPSLDHHFLVLNGRQVSLSSSNIQGFHQFLDLQRAIVWTHIEIEVDAVLIRWIRGVAVPRMPGNRVLSVDHVTSTQPCSVTLMHVLSSPQGNGYLGGSEPRVRRHHLIERSISEAKSDELEHVVWSGSTSDLRWEVWHETATNGEKSSFVSSSDVICSVGATISPQIPLWSIRCVTVNGVANPSGPEILRGYFNDHISDWMGFWARPCIEIDGPEADVFRLRFAQFQLQQAAGMRDVEIPWNTGARGLTSQYHSGHVFFNSELYLLPYYAYARPEVANRLIKHRIATLGEAERYAREGGLFGARYPEEADLQGRESSARSSVDYDSGETRSENSGEFVMHNSALIIWALIRYIRQTSDARVLTDASEMVVSVGRYLHSLLTRTYLNNGSYGVCGVMGFDEFHYPVNNHFATNYLAAWALHACADLVMDPRHRQTQSREDIELEVVQWRNVARRIYLPSPSPTGVLEQSDGFFALPDRLIRRDPSRYLEVDLSEQEQIAIRELSSLPTQMIKQSDCVLLMALFPERFGFDTMKNTWRFYSARTVHDSSLSLGPSSLVAFAVGEKEEALTQWRACMDYNISFHPREGYRNGVHVASYAGGLLAIIEGAAGVRLNSEKLAVNAHLPDEWNRLVLRLQCRGQTVMVEISKDAVSVNGERIDIRLISPAEEKGIHGQGHYAIVSPSEGDWWL